MLTCALCPLSPPIADHGGETWLIICISTDIRFTLVPNHTFYFSLEDGRVIDANVGGNAARWINHSCKPNCEADEIQVGGESRVFIFARRKLLQGEELFYDYSLNLDGKLTKKEKRDYACYCGSKKCRGTMLDLG